MNRKGQLVKLLSVSNKDGSPKLNWKHQNRIGNVGVLGFFEVNNSTLFAFRVEGENILRSSIVECVKITKGLMIVRTLNSIYTFHNLYISHERK